MRKENSDHSPSKTADSHILHTSERLIVTFVSQMTRGVKAGSAPMKMIFIGFLSRFSVTNLKFVIISRRVSISVVRKIAFVSQANMKKGALKSYNRLFLLDFPISSPKTYEHKRGLEFTLTSSLRTSNFTVITS